MLCRCGKTATHKARWPIRRDGGSANGGRIVIGGPAFWCDDCTAIERARTPGLIAVGLHEGEAHED